MTPKEKAEELRDKMYHSDLYVASKYAAQQCALIAVEEILNAHLFDLDEKEYWQQVKEEITNL